MSKYNAKKCEYCGIIFDSKKEVSRYIELKIREKAWEITGLQRQVKYTLIPAQYEESEDVYKSGKNKGKPKRGKLLERECSYTADFVYYDEISDETVVEDVKGFKTKEYRIKKKLMLYVHGIRIKEV